MEINATTYPAYQAAPTEANARPQSASLSETGETGTTGQSDRANTETPDHNSEPPDSRTTSPAASDTSTEAVQTRLTQDELRVVDQLQQIDAEVRRHEMAHIAAGGGLITGGASFSYQRGPDGKNYAVGGEVGIDTSPVPGDPQATIRKMQQVRSAALAPASPSTQDVKVASQATSMAAKAMAELTIIQAEQQANARETQASSGPQNAADTYARVGELPEADTSTFRLAV